MERMTERRSDTNAFPDGMEQKDHILRLARGVECEGGSLRDFIGLLKLYVDAADDTGLDSNPLYQYWQIGGA